MPLIRKQVAPTNSGIVKWYNAAKGFGFVTVIAAQEYDIFIHFSEFVDLCASFSVQAGQLLLFDIQVGVKGPQAADIVVV
jgi:cold shock protein